ncbi:heme peroxidase [Microdochium trichocladiopsis]|uniref:Heme peroxidase n=1 Tax=Microdochium trichocladiopsis TaxID=1682393 RepID=A0A9P8Y5N1_9PEZI|nr:heme peroxidase [Microdochium trichocladiopsis]KAH7030729.1 heme peroxidase [Microdochium trichocladiopsis]
MNVTRGAYPSQHGDGTMTLIKNRPGLKQDLKHIKKKDVKTIIKLVKAKVKGELNDDKTMLMEQVIQLVAGLPHHSKLRDTLTNNLIGELWNTLEHPPLLYLGEKFQYRQADGSWNNPKDPFQGAAGTPYARTCRPSLVHPGALPDPGLIFEAVMKKRSHRSHPNNVSSVLWYWATIIIHDLFWTDYRNQEMNKADSYLDLAPLYGHNQEMQDSIRTFKDGMMKPDTFADKRMLGMPPACSIILIMFNRYHNYIAKNLALINENGRFTPPSPDLPEDKAAAAWKKYDNDLFQTARLVTSGLYINITLVDYVRNIVNLNRSNTTWTLDPRQEMGVNQGTKDLVAAGTGSAVSAEFNLCYRWHSCISAKDDKWVQDFYREIFNKDPLTVTERDMMMGFMKFEKSIPDEPAERVFGGFKRTESGAFLDDDLVNCISDAIEDCAGAFGGRNVPEAMKPVEILGILQGRRWNVAGLNEFRKHFGLKPFETFEEINSDPEIADSLRHLYEHPDLVELYPGLVAEEAKEPMVPGVGIAPTYTISRVILSDAVCLTRGDRFYTTDYSPKFLTNWGFNEASYDLDLNQGCVFYKLFIRAFPNHFKRDSAYAHYPMCVPSETQKILTNLGRVKHFSFDRPAYHPPSVNINSFAGAKHVVSNPTKYGENVQEGLAAMLATLGTGKETPVQPRSDNNKPGQLFKPEWAPAVKSLYAQIMAALLKEKSYNLAGASFVDIVRDVGNLAPTRFAAELFGLPLQTKEKPKGVFTDDELYMALATIHMSLSHDHDPVKSFPRRQAAAALAHQLGTLLEASVKKAGGGLFGGKPKAGSISAYGAEMIKTLSQSGLSSRDIAWSHLLPAVASVVPTIAEMFAQGLDFYLTPEGTKHIFELQRIAGLASSPETDALLLGYCLEGVRLSGGFVTSRAALAPDTITEDDGTQVRVHAGERVFVNFASKDAAHFPEPAAVNPRRPAESYVFLSAMTGSFTDRGLVEAGVTEMFRGVFRLKNVRRAPGPQGELKKVRQQETNTRADGAVVYLREDRGAYVPFPCTMRVCYDE